MDYIIITATYIVVAWIAYSAGKSRMKEILENEIKRNGDLK